MAVFETSAWQYDWQAIATFAAAILASSVAGLVAWRVGKRQTEIMTEQSAIQLRQAEIQSSLVGIEETKIRLELLERRSSLIDAIWGVIATTRIDHKVIIHELYAKRVDELSKHLTVGKFCFSGKSSEAINTLSVYLSIASDLNIKIYNKNFDEESDELAGKLKSMEPVLNKLILEQLGPEIYVFDIK